MARLMLTFDDGPDPLGTPLVLDALAAARARATFFVIAPRAESHPELIARIVRAGHTVGVHCDEHLRHTDRDAAWLARDTVRALGRLDRLGIRPRLWRTPWGVRAPWTDALAARLGLRLVHWQIDTHDWRGDPAEVMFAEVSDQIADGAIVLAHDGIGPGAQRDDCAQTAAFIALAARQAGDQSLDLVAL